MDQSSVFFEFFLLKQDKKRSPDVKTPVAIFPISYLPKNG